jgi:O-antigen ligase
MFGFCIALAFGVRPAGSLLRWSLLASAGILLAAVIFSGTRAAWVSLIVPLGLIASAHLFHRFRPGRLIAAGVALLVVAQAVYRYLLSAALLRHIMSIGNLESNWSNLERINRWVAALNMWSAAPLTGHGWTMYKFEYAAYRDLSFQTPFSHEMIGAHNEFLTVLSEAGLIGFIPFLGIIAGCWLLARRIRRATDDPFIEDAALGLLSGILAYLVHGLFNNYLMYDKVAVPFWVSIGLLAALRRMQAMGEARGD